MYLNFEQMNKIFSQKLIILKFTFRFCYLLYSLKTIFQ